MNNIQKTIMSLGVLLIAASIVVHNPFGGYKRKYSMYSKAEYIKLYRDRDNDWLYNRGLRKYVSLSNLSDSEVYQVLLMENPNPAKPEPKKFLN